MKRMVLFILGLTFVMTVAGCGSNSEKMTQTPIEEITVKSFTAGASVHDPSIIVGEDGKYYIFGSHMDAASSSNLHNWKSIASGVSDSNPLFKNLFEPDFKAFDFVGKNDEGWYSVWAPDVIYNKAMGKYMMYFCTTSSYIKSNLCFAVSDNIEGPYEYVDTILYSGFAKVEMINTNFYDIMTKDVDTDTYVFTGLGYLNSLWPNCIDPTVFYDTDDRMWMVYGSWSGGIFLLELDEATGYPIHPTADPENEVDTYYGRRLIGGGHRSIEGPYIMYDEESQYYYLFVSYGGLTSDGGYQIRIFRSESVEGPYLDAAGERLGDVPDHSTYGVKMMGNYTLPSLKKAYMAPGHCSAFTDTDGKKYVVYHTRFDDGQEYHEPRVHQLFTTKNGWLAAAPFATVGESLNEEGYDTAQMEGTWYVLNHGLDISSAIHEAQEVEIDKKGAGTGMQLAVEEGTSYVTVTMDGVTYEGVVIDMQDEAENETRCITAVGDNNQTIWMVHYK